MQISKLLLIDDDQDSRDGIADTLQETPGFQVVSFVDGPSALAHLEDHWQEYVIVLLDFVLDPGMMAGEAVLRTLRSAFPRLPVVVFTGVDHQGSLRTLAQGAYAIQQRPLDFVELNKIIKGVTESIGIFVQMAEDLRSLLADLGFTDCLAWRLERKEHVFRIAGWSGDLDNDYRQSIVLQANDPEWQQFLSRGKPLFLADVTDSAVAPRYRYVEQARERNWRSLLTIPLVHDGRVLAMLDCYSHAQFTFESEQQRRLLMGTLRAFAHQAVEAVRYTELTLQTRALQEINQTLANTLEEDAIIRSVLFKAQELTGADCGWLYIHDANAGVLKLREAVGVEKEKLDAERQLGAGISGWVAVNGIAYSLANTLSPQVGEDHPHHIPTAGVDVLSEVAVPLRRGARTIGVLTAKSRYVGYFAEDDIDLLMSLAALAVVAFERTKLTAHLHEVSQLALSSDSFQTLAKYVVSAVRDLTGADVALWTRSNREGEGDSFLRIVACRGNVSDRYRRTARLSTSSEGSVAGKALHEHRSVIRKDLLYDAELPQFDNLTEAMEQGWRSCMIVPMLDRENGFVGVLSLYSVEVGKFGPSDGQLVETFTNQASLAFQQKKYAAALHRLAEVGEALAGEITGARDLLEHAAKTACDVTGAECVVIYPYDAARQDYYQLDAIAQVGLKGPGKATINKPRAFGLTALVRKYAAIVVHDVGDLQVQVGLDKPLKRNSALAEIRLRVTESHFIKREKIKAFVGVSLRAHNGKGDPDSQEVGVLYLNYRAPHRFSQKELQIIRIYANHMANVIQSARLFAQKQRQADELQILHESTLKILQRQDVIARLEEIVEAAIRLLKAGGGKVFLHELRCQCLRLVAKRGIADDIMPIDYELAEGEGMAGKVFSSRTPMITSDYATWEGRSERLAAAFSAMVEVPLLIEDEPTGVLAVFDDASKHTFSSEDQFILERLARQAALAIHNAQIDESMQATIGQLNALYDTSIAITSEVELPDVAGRILDELGRFIRYDKATVQLIDGEHRTLSAYRGFAADQIDTATLLRPITQDNLVMRVIAGREPYVLADTAEDGDWQQIPATSNVRSWVCVPLFLDQQAIGLLTLDHSVAGYYRYIDRDTLVLFANLAAIAIQKADLRRKLQERVRDLEFVDAVVRIIGAKLETPELLYSIVQQIGVRLECTQCTLFIPYPEAGRILLRAEVVFPPEKAPVDIHVFAPGEGLAGWVYQKGQSVCLADAQADARFLAIRASASKTPRSMLLVPVKAGETVIGVISADREQLNWFDGNHEHLLNALAGHVAIALERARLFEEFDEGRRQYIQDVAHQLIGPLAGLRAHASNLTQDFLSPERRSAVLAEMVDMAGMVQRYAENFKYAARTEPKMFGPSEYDPQAYTAQALVQLLEQCADAYRPKAANKGLLGIEIDGESFLDFPVLALDQDKFSLLILNLLDNAVNYSYAKTPIWIRGAVFADHVEISLIDHGISLSQEDADHLFQRNYRSLAAQNAAPGGTGIGLYVCKKIALLHHGDINAESSHMSTYGDEVKFTVALPYDSDAI